MELTTEAMYDIITNTIPHYDDEAIDLLISVNGFNKQTMLDILEYYTGYKDFYTWLDEMEENA